MFKCFSRLIMSAFFAASAFLGAIDYDIQDIGTLQTHSSQPIAINNQGQILGWYNIDGSSEGKHFFVRERDGNFHVLPRMACDSGWEINWRYLTSEGKVYGTFDGNSDYSVLYMWDQQNGLVKLGNLPGKNISAINDKGQVLISSVLENECGKTIRRPVIWHNGVITKLKGLVGNVGIESEESLGLDMNNNGDVVGQSVVYLSYKNDLYKQTHAVKWINGEAIDLHREVPKSTSTAATTINDLGDVIVGGYLVRADGEVISHYLYSGSTKATNRNYFYNISYANSFVDRYKDEVNVGSVQKQLNKDYDTIWMSFNNIVHLNDNGEVVALGMTIYGEWHAMLLTPKCECK